MSVERLVEVQKAHRLASLSLTWHRGRLGVRCRCGVFAPCDHWSLGLVLMAEHQADAVVREWLAGVLDEAPSWEDDSRLGGRVVDLDELRDRLGITGRRAVGDEGVMVVRRPGGEWHRDVPRTGLNVGAYRLTSCGEELSGCQITTRDVDPDDLCRRCFPEVAG